MSVAKREQKERYLDCHGVAFDEVRLILGEDRSQWPKPIVRVLDDSIERTMHEWFNECWNCGSPSGWNCSVQTHHSTGGTKGRSDEFTNICMLCEQFGVEGCHKKANTAELPFGRILFLMWKHNKRMVSWSRLTILHGRFLPDLITK